MRPNCVIGSSPRSRSFGVAAPLVQVLPVHIQRQRHSVAFDPGPQRIRHRPDRLLLAQLCPGRVRRVIDHVDQTALGSALLQPAVKAPVHLHHLSKVFLALAPTAVPLPPPLPTPQSLRQHPPPQRLRIDFQPVLRSQVFRRQRRPESLAHRPAVLLPHQPQHLLAETSSPVRGSSAVPRCGASDPPLLPPDSASTTASPAGNSLPAIGSHLRSVVACSEPAPALPPVPTPSCSSPSASIGPPLEDPFKGTFLSRTKGDIITEVQQNFVAN